MALLLLRLVLLRLLLLLTAATAAGLSVLAGKLTAGLAVSDTAAAIATNLNGLQTLFLAGKLSLIAIADSSVLSLAAATIAADAGALSTIAASYTITPSGTIGAALAAGISTGIKKWLGFSLQRFGSVRWIACRLIRTFCCWRGGAQGGRSPTGAAPRQQQFSHTATLCGRWSR